MLSFVRAQLCLLLLGGSGCLLQTPAATPCAADGDCDNPLLRCDAQGVCRSTSTSDAGPDARADREVPDVPVLADVALDARGDVDGNEDAGLDAGVDAADDAGIDVPPPFSECGNGLVEDEPCDDGNLRNGDGCSNLCVVEPGARCTTALGARSICLADASTCLPDEVQTAVLNFSAPPGNVETLIVDPVPGDVQLRFSDVGGSGFDLVFDGDGVETMHVPEFRASNATFAFDPSRRLFIRFVRRDPGRTATWVNPQIRVGDFDTDEEITAPFLRSTLNHVTQLDFVDHASLFVGGDVLDNERLRGTGNPAAIDIDAQVVFDLSGFAIGTFGFPPLGTGEVIHIDLGDASLCAFDGCGDQRIDTGETCDDANRVGGDGCDGNCQLEPTGFCSCRTAWQLQGPAPLNAPTDLGGPGGGSARPNIDCPANEVAIGVEGTVDEDQVRSLRLRCAQPFVTPNHGLVTSTPTLTAFTPTSNGNTEGSFVADCPENTVLFGFRARRSGGNELFDSLTVQCATLTAVPTLTSTRTPIVETSIPITGQNELDQQSVCELGEVVVGLGTIRTGTRLDRVSARCRPLIHDCGDSGGSCVLFGG